MPWELSDDKLLAECRVESFVSSGPGGQKRHKTNAAVRITHLPTRISAVETESRSNRENKIHALRDLRHKLAMEIRREVDLTSYQPPAWVSEYEGVKMNPKNPLYPSLVAEILDLMNAVEWSIGRTAAMLGFSTAALTRFLYAD
ncbi:MAG TPA: peptide chain release factor-like protein, partial [Tepidisphaeraceae bacterium]|nr:peptide chain release factor-like protein [Tepidisphaeraceae bacterium]